MPLISCPVCNTVYTVQDESLGQMTRCRKCSTRFKAIASKSGIRNRKQSNALIFAVFGVVLLMVVLIIFTTAGGSSTPSPAPTNSGSSSTSNPAAANAATSAGSTSTPTTATALGSAQRCLAAIDAEDSMQLMLLVSYPRFQEELVKRGQGGKNWSDLDSTGQTLARQAISERILGDASQRRFLAESKVESINVARSDAKEAEVQALRRNLVRDQETQGVTLRLNAVDGHWFVHWIEYAEVTDPAKQKAKTEQAAAAAAGRRSRMGLGEIVKIAPLASTSEEDRGKIEGLVRTMISLEETRKASAAKRELVAIGKPAIPALLNEIVGRETLASMEDRQIVNQLVQALEGITQVDSIGFAPGGEAGTMTGEMLEDNVISLKRWFGWWDKNKDTWTGPKPESSEDK